MEQIALTGIERIRFTTSHPWDFTLDMIKVISEYDNMYVSIDGNEFEFDNTNQEKEIFKGKGYN